MKISAKWLGLPVAMALLVPAASPASASTTLRPPMPVIAVSWGAGGSGQLGNGATADTAKALPSTPLSGITNVASIAAGDDFTLALLYDGTVVAWGDNASGQLGNGTTTSSDVPVPVTGLSGVRYIAAGGSHALALLQNGTVMAWGDNAHGQLGDGTTTNSDVPVAVPGVAKAIGVAAGGDFSAAIVPAWYKWLAPPAGTLMVWGGNDHGQLGIGSTVDSTTPVPVSSLGTKVRSIRGGPDFMLIQMADWSVRACGDGASGQLGDGSTADSDVPMTIAGLNDAIQLAAGTASGYALERSGAVEAWGDNGHGQLGNGTTTNSDVPGLVTGLSTVQDIAASGAHALALLKSHAVEAWGDNGNGELGNGTTTDGNLPAAVPDLAGVRTIASGAQFSVARARVRPATLGARTSATARTRTAFSKTLRVRSLPNLSTITVSGKLPAGVTFVNNGDNSASLVGTPAAGSAGSYPLTVTASNGIGSAAQESVSLVVKS